MLDDTPETAAEAKKFDPSAYPPDTLFHERRGGGGDRRSAGAARPDAESPPPRPVKERRVRKERRRRIDPTTFEKQYTDDELEFMNAMQRFKVQSCKSFPSHGDVLRVAMSLGYRKVGATGPADSADTPEEIETADESEATVEPV
jgi:hypothetical protein